MNVTVVIPWRDTSPDRASALDYVIMALADILPGSSLILADTHHEQFNRAAARNVGVFNAALDGADVIVCLDADTIPEAEPLLAAIEAAATDGALHYPFTDFRGLTRDATQAYYDGRPLADCPTEYECVGSQGGVLVCTPTVWFAAGGMDERFTGWGFEDTAFSMAVRTFVGDVVYHPGAIHHLWHPSAMDMESVSYQANRALCAVYETAYMDPDAMRQVRRGVEAV